MIERSDAARIRREPIIVRLGGGERAIRPLPFTRGAEWIARAIECERDGAIALLRARLDEGKLDTTSAAELWRAAAAMFDLVAQYCGLTAEERAAIDAELGAMEPAAAIAQIAEAYGACIAMSVAADFRPVGAEGKT